MRQARYERTEVTTDESTINVRKGGWGTTNSPLTYHRDPEKRKPRCQGATVNAGWSGQCTLAGTYLETDESGKAYYWCGTHAPSKVAAKRERRNAEDAARWEERKADIDHAATLATARVELFDALAAFKGGQPGRIVAGERVLDAFDAYLAAGGSRDDMRWSERAR